MFIFSRLQLQQVTYVIWFYILLCDVLDCEVDHKAEDLFLMEMDTTHSLRQYFCCPFVRYQSIEVHVAYMYTCKLPSCNKTKYKNINFPTI